MKHLSDISALVRTLHQSDRFHALVIQSPPGWAKSTTVNAALEELKVRYRGLGSYTTPLSLYNELSKTPDMTLVLDDCAGLFSDVTTMSILKSASWGNSGSLSQREVKWLSTSEKVAQSHFIFSGKLILLTNVIPAGNESTALLSRSLVFKLKFSGKEIREMLFEAASSIAHFSDVELAKTVATALLENGIDKPGQEVNLRTLQIYYELAKCNPESWRELLGRLSPPSPAQEVVRQLSESTFSVEKQSREFIRRTGMSRRTFFNYRQLFIDENYSS